MPINGNVLKIRLGHTHIQDVAADVWTIVHNLGREVISDVVVDIGGKREKILPLGVEHPDTNTMVITFTQPLTGSARVS